MEWTREKTMSLISEYRKRRGLWDMTHDDYRKKEMKQKLLVEVSSSLGGGIPIVEIEKKFHTLRTQYHREINRMKRKEPYNSKWFGFKNLQFLSSPKACRSNKGRIKSEITEEGTVTTKYIIRDATAVPQSQHDSSGNSVHSNSNLNEEFLTLRTSKPNSFEAVGGNISTATSRSQELEKLIEETTKDVEDIEEAKPKMTIKEISLPLDHHHSYTQELPNVSEEHMQSQHHQTTQMDEDEPLETIDLHDDEIAYQSSSSTGIGQTTTTTTLHHHQHAMPRIIKIQRRDTCHEDEYYNQEQEMPKRIYYESNGHQHTATILTPTATPQPNANSTLLNPLAKMPQLRAAGTHIAQQQLQQSSTSSQQQMRDEYATYGEYVANEMRGITNREILVTLKHKINTALFEAHSAELQK